MPDGEIDVEPDVEKGDMDVTQTTGDHPRQRRQPAKQPPPANALSTGEVPAIMPPPRPTREEVIRGIATELTRIGQDLTYPLAKHGIDRDPGAAFTRLDCGSRVYAAAARLAELLTPPDSPELDRDS